MRGVHTTMPLSIMSNIMLYVCVCVYHPWVIKICRKKNALYIAYTYPSSFYKCVVHGGDIARYTNECVYGWCGGGVSTISRTYVSMFGYCLGSDPTK